MVKALFPSATRGQGERKRTQMSLIRVLSRVLRDLRVILCPWLIRYASADDLLVLLLLFVAVAAVARRAAEAVGEAQHRRARAPPAAADLHVRQVARLERRAVQVERVRHH